MAGGRCALAAMVIVAATAGRAAPAADAARSCRPPGAKASCAAPRGRCTRRDAAATRPATSPVTDAATKPLFLGGADCFNAQAPSQFVLARRWLGYVSTSCDTVSGSDTVVVFDLRSRRRRVAAIASRTAAASAGPVRACDRVALARTGEIAWIASYVTGGTRTYEVRRSTPVRGESVLLDAGPDVAADSLAAGAGLVLLDARRRRAIGATALTGAFRPIPHKP